MVIDGWSSDWLNVLRFTGSSAWQAASTSSRHVFPKMCSSFLAFGRLVIPAKTWERHAAVRGVLHHLDHAWGEVERIGSGWHGRGSFSSDVTILGSLASWLSDHFRHVDLATTTLDLTTVSEAGKLREGNGCLPSWRCGLGWCRGGGEWWRSSTNLVRKTTG